LVLGLGEHDPGYAAFARHYDQLRETWRSAVP
jgi:hypothetical protein